MVYGPLKDLYFRRKQEERNEIPDYFSEKLNESVKNKIIMRIMDFSDTDLMKRFGRSIERQLGLNLFTGPWDYEIEGFLKKCSDDLFCTALEIFLILMIPHNAHNIDNFIEIINKTFLIDKIGFEIIKSEGLDVPFIFVPFNSQYLHNETVKKPRELLWNSKFNEELSDFDKALDKYRNGDYEQTCFYAGKSFEGTIKKICKLKNIPYDENNNNIPRLIISLKENGLIHQKLKGEFECIYKALDKGPNNIRNIVAHSNDNKIPKNMEKTYAEFCLSSAGNHIVFLIEAYELNK
ncbi:DUF7014 domain-containing protein [Methanococcus maripaludis]|uniref:HEPN domain-containing protein n=1 Tax=Methanococcus maripaludis TaxID=39152 RepID=A0A8T4CJU5_METMI|nr:hypothetical protein [Methanococcus maripaludis]MBM7408425.1 HEPN domain-containing protein [Methanococcus maripaludis]MBP2220095.1 HEPN domain-containing protein [Methanococcus maripaludis]